MKDKDMQQIWENYLEEEPRHWSTRMDQIKQSQKDAEIDRVTCHCNLCEHWSAGNKCVASEIELVLHEGKCVCKTYNPVG